MHPDMTSGGGGNGTPILTSATFDITQEEPGYYYNRPTGG
jgi:hypothetical protein